MTKAPPAEQAMRRDGVAEVVRDEGKLDASEFDGCWLTLPDHDCWPLFDTSFYVQKHVDEDTMVSNAVELTLLALILPCFCPCVTFLCCPRKYVSVRSTTDRREVNSFGHGVNSFDSVDTSEEGDESQSFEQTLPRRCDRVNKNGLLNIYNETWHYSGGSRATSRPWFANVLSADPFGDALLKNSPTMRILFQDVKFSKAVRCAPACCCVPVFDRNRQLVSSYLSGANS
jgi:hypothetical protein